MVQFDKEAQANAANARLAEFAKAEEAKATFAMRALLSSIEGRALLWWLLRIGGVGLQPFQGDPYKTAFNCGELNVGQQILAKVIETEPAGYVRLLEDQQNVERERTRLQNVDEVNDVPNA